MYFLLFRNYLPLEKGHGLSFALHPRFCAKLVKIGPIVLEKINFKFRQCIFAIRNFLPLEKGVALYESPSPKDALCQIRLQLAQWFKRRRFLNFDYVFSLFCYYLPLEKSEPFIWINLNLLHPRMLYAKFGWNWPSDSEEDF